MDKITYQYVSINKNRSGKHSYLFDCVNDTNKCGEIFRCNMLMYGYIFNRNSLIKEKGWWIFKNYWIEKSEIPNFFKEESGIKRVKLYRH